MKKNFFEEVMNKLAFACFSYIYYETSGQNKKILEISDSLQRVQRRNARGDQSTGAPVL